MNVDSNNNKISIPKWMMFLIATACGLIVANLYYAQPIVGLISADTGILAEQAGFIVTMTQIGYAVGLLFIVPLSDKIENRLLIASTLMIAVIGLILAAMAKQPIYFLIAAVLIGLGAVAAQVLVPFAAYLANDNERGRVVGNVMSGLLLGIMLARPASSLITGIWGWHLVYIISAILMIGLIIVLSLCLPKRNIKSNTPYKDIIKSLWFLLKTEPVLRRRALYQACLFGCFSIFWTVVPLWLSKHFNLSQEQIAFFAFMGVAGAIAAPIAGKLADKGFTKPLTGLAFVIAIVAFVITNIIQSNSGTALFLFFVAAVLLDMSVSGNLVLGQQAIYALGEEIRGRVNGVFMAIFFVGGAFGSAFGAWLFAKGGWHLTTILGVCLPLLAFLYYLTELNRANIKRNTLLKFGDK